MDFSKINDEHIREQIFEFMGKFNNMFNNDISTDCDAFIRFSLLDNGGLYLQPCVVMLHKFLKPLLDLESSTWSLTSRSETFAIVLEAIYAHHIPANPCITRFIKYYDSNTLQCYTDTYEFMMEHMCFLYTNKLSPFASINEQINSLLCTHTSERSSTFREALDTMTKEERQRKINDLINVYVDALIQLRVIMFNNTTRNYYILVDGTHYKVTSKIEDLPTEIYNWGDKNRILTSKICSKLCYEEARYTVCTLKLLSACKFQFSTAVGVFNSLTGMYTAKTRFLRFLCYRSFAVWKFNEPYRMYRGQNYDVLDRLVLADKYARFMHEDISSLFVHFLLAPAIIQLQDVAFIQESSISKLIDILRLHNNLSSAYFLLEYFPIDPPFIFLIMYISKKFGGFNSLETYTKMSAHIFTDKKVDEAAWKEKFESVLGGVTYEKKESYMDTLMTLNGENVNDVSQEFCFHATIIAVCMIRCPMFSKFVRAFNVETMPKPLQIKPEYSNFKADMSIESYKSNMQRAIKILFGTDLSLEEQNIITTMFSIGISSFFDPETTTELLASVSALFFPYNGLKKFFLYRGLGKVGKSWICNIIEKMTSPKVIRPNKFDHATDTVTNNVTILDEVRSIDGGKLKTVTGNDGLSFKHRNTREYELHDQQSLMYGATKWVIPVRPKSNNDSCLIGRFHVIKLTGQQCSANFQSCSLLTMLTNSEVYEGTIESTTDELANAMSWLSYASYILRRNVNLFPLINENNIHSKQYWDDYTDDLRKKTNRL